MSKKTGKLTLLKRNPTDATLRNVRADVKRQISLLQRVAKLQTRVDRLEASVPVAFALINLLASALRLMQLPTDPTKRKVAARALKKLADSAR